MREETLELARRLRQERVVQRDGHILKLFFIDPEACKNPTGSWQLAKVVVDPEHGQEIWVDVGETFESVPVGQWDPVLTLAAWVLKDDDDEDSGSEYGQHLD